MEKQLVILKTGRTLPSLLKQYGDFEEWIIAKMAIAHESITVVDVVHKSPFPDFKKVLGVIITGSHAMVTERHDWIERMAEWVQKAVTIEIPLLGICFGHQLLAYALGGEVGDNPYGHEIGTMEVTLNQNGVLNTLFAELPNPVLVQVSHTQSVVRLPENATLLAYSNKDPHQAFVIGEKSWGVQFHPEFNARIVTGYIRHMRETLIKNRQDPDEILKHCEDTPFGTQILCRFLKICMATLNSPP